MINRHKVATLWSNSAILKTIGTIIGWAPDFSLLWEGFWSAPESLTVSPALPDRQWGSIKGGKKKEIARVED